MHACIAACCPGSYVRFTFQDNGCGMSDDVRDHLFEPFFTTKQVGHGTGLGLSTVYGIVRQHDAYIDVTSRESAGTAFRHIFPRLSSTTRPASITGRTRQCGAGVPVQRQSCW